MALECRTQWARPLEARERGQGPSLLSQIVYKLPPSPLNQGATGSIVSAPIPTNAVAYVTTIQQVGWSNSGGAALKVWLDVSYNDEGSWENLTEDTFPDEAVAAYRTIPANAFRIAASMGPEVGGVKRKLRLRYEAVKAVTVLGTVVSFVPAG